MNRRISQTTPTIICHHLRHLSSLKNPKHKRSRLPNSLHTSITMKIVEVDASPATAKFWWAINLSKMLKISGKETSFQHFTIKLQKLSVLLKPTRKIALPTFAFFQMGSKLLSITQSCIKDSGYTQVMLSTQCQLLALSFTTLWLTQAISLSSTIRLLSYWDTTTLKEFLSIHIWEAREWSMTSPKCQDSTKVWLSWMMGAWWRAPNWASTSSFTMDLRRLRVQTDL